MFSQSADQPAADQSPAPVGMRELPPQPAKPVMPAYPAATPTMTEPTAPTPATADGRPGSEDSVIARDDHLEGTFTSRGTVVVMGSVKGRIEAVQVRIEEGATVEADVIVDEAIIAGEFTGNLTCRERLEAHASGRINGHVETFKLMLHEGASVEGEMHMLTGSPKDASETIRGSAPVRGDTDETKAEGQPATRLGPGAAVAKPSASATPSSSAKPTTSAVGSATTGSGSAVSSGATVEATAVRSSVVETLRAENALVVAPRATTTSRGYGSSSYSGNPVSSVGTGSGSRNGTTNSGF